MVKDLDVNSSSFPLRKPCDIIVSMSPSDVEAVRMDLRKACLADTGQKSTLTKVDVVVAIMSIFRDWIILWLLKMPVWTEFSLVTIVMMPMDAILTPTLTKGLFNLCFTQPKNPRPPPMKKMRTRA